MILEAKAVKVVIALGVPIAVTSSHLIIDPFFLLFVIIGLIIGWLARVGKMIHDQKPAVFIKRDLIVSLLIGAGNGLLALIIISTFGLSYIQGIGVAFLCAFAGVRTFETVLSAAVDKLLRALGRDKYERD